MNQDKAKQWFDIWRDNSDPHNINRGIISYARECFPRQIEPKYGTPDIHKHLYYMILQMFHPKFTQFPDRQLQFELFRDAAKSTTGLFVLGSYIVCMNGHEILIADTDDEPYKIGEPWDINVRSLNGVLTKLEEDVIMIMSETHALAEVWTLKIRAQISGNAKIKEVFGHMKPIDLRDDEGKWTASSFTALKDKAAISWQRGRSLEVVAKGINQQVRGYNTLGRITTALLDDLYSFKTTLTVETRQKTRAVVQSELKNGIDQNKGKALYIGTKVHDDTIIVDNENNRRVRVIKYPAMDKQAFMHIITTECKIDSEKRLCHIPDRKRCEELESMGYVTNWKEHLSLYLLLTQYSEAFEGKVEGKSLTGFWQEKFHETLSEEDKKFKRSQMKDLQFDLIVHNIEGNNTTYIRINKGLNEKGEIVHEYRNVNTCIAIDAATSYRTGADDTAIIWMCKDYYGRLYFYKHAGGKFGVNDTFISEDFEREYIDKLCLDKSNLLRIGSSDEVFRWVGRDQGYKLVVVVETNSVGNEVVRAIRRKSRQYGRSLSVIEVVTTQVKKEDRIADELGSDFEAGMVYFNSDYNWEVLKNQLEYLGKTSKDDYADCAAIGRANLQKPHIIISELAKPKEKKIQTIIQQMGLNKIANKVSDVWRT